MSVCVSGWETAVGGGLDRTVCVGVIVSVEVRNA